MKTPKEIAEGIVWMIRLSFLELNASMSVVELAKHNADMKEAVDSIAAAIQAERDANTPPAVVWTCKPPKGYVLTDDGVARRVLGELPMTADGCVVGDSWCGGLFWIRGIHNDVVGPSHSESRVEFLGPEQWHRPHNCYSTREAAEAAKKEGHTNGR